jgi:hypothetical protein
MMLYATTVEANAWRRFRIGTGFLRTSELLMRSNALKKQLGKLSDVQN